MALEAEAETTAAMATPDALESRFQTVRYTFFLHYLQPMDGEHKSILSCASCSYVGTSAEGVCKTFQCALSMQLLSLSMQLLFVTAA